MTLQTLVQRFAFPIPGTSLGSPTGFGDSASISGIDAADEKYSVIFQNPETKNISKLWFMTGTVTTGADIDVRIETVSTSDGNPTGTLLATNSNHVQTITSGNDNTEFEVTLDAVAAATRGQLVSAVLANPGSSFGNIQFRYCSPYNVGGRLPYTALFTSSWAKSASVTPLIAIGYDDGSWAVPPGCIAFNATSAATFNNTSTPDIKGLKFQFPFGIRVSGFWFVGDMDGEVDIRLVTSAYHEANATGILESIALDPDQRPSVAAGQYNCLLDTPVEIAASTASRLIIVPTSATNVTLAEITFPNAGIAASFNGGTNFSLTTAKDPTGDGSWTNYNNGTDGYRQPLMGLLIDGIDIPAGGGSFVTPAMIQNLSGGLAA